MSVKQQKAWFYNEYGPLEVLQFGDFAVPQPGPGQVLVKVRAAALNPADFKRLEGLLDPAGRADFKRLEDLLGPADSDFPAVPGCDMCGEVVEVGEGATKFKKGDVVYSDVQNFTAGRPKQLGTLAQYTVVEETLAAHKPTSLSIEEAASLPLAVLTAQQAFDIVSFQSGQSVFIVGGAGGVGSLAIQLARHVYGASRIVSTCSTAKMEFVKSLGADLAVDYTKQSYDDIPEKFDFVFDTIGESSKSCVVAKGAAPVIDIASFQPIPRAKFFVVSPSASNLERLRPYIESGKLRPVIDPKGPYAFSDVLEALKHQQSGRAIGKIVISPID